jgi:hypothetical protein
MYNTHMFKFLLLVLLSLTTASCAMREGYNPVAAATAGTFELNQSALNNVTLGMTQSQVHQIMGETITIGYNYGSSAEPITLKNPYKTSELEDGSKGKCTVEYYATSVIVPDGIVSDSELMPLKFCKGVLTSKGWDKIK